MENGMPYEKINLILKSPSQDGSTVKQDVSVPIDTKVGKLLPAIITKLNLPKITQNNQAVKYILVRAIDGVTIDEDLTLADVGLVDKETVLIVGNISKEKRSAVEKLPVPDRELIDAVESTAPIYIPSRESLAIGLVPIDLVYRLEEYRSDEKKWESILWAFIGAILGIATSWLTAENLQINNYSIILLIVFVVMATFSGVTAYNYQKRAGEIKKKLNQFLEKP